MKINYDNIIFSLQNAGGASIYWTELIKRIKFRNDINFFEFENENIFRKKLDIETKKEFFFSSKLLRYFPIIQRLEPKSLFHSSYYRTTLQKDVVKIVTVYDFTYEYYRKGIAKIIHSWQKNLAIKNADGVICISESTKRDLFNFIPNINPEKVKTIYIGSGEEFYKIKDVQLKEENAKFKKLIDKKIVLYVGDRKSHYKNFRLVLEVVRALKGYTLVSAGSGNISKKEKHLINKKIGDRYVHFSNINSKELNILYNISFCLLYPSSYEGFGIPLLEAMRAGCPVISTDFSSIPEVAGDAAILVNDLKKENFVESIKLLENQVFRCKLVDKGFEQVKKFSWEKCARETREFYENIKQLKFKK